MLLKCVYQRVSIRTSGRDSTHCTRHRNTPTGDARQRGGVRRPPSADARRWLALVFVVVLPVVPAAVARAALTAFCLARSGFTCAPQDAPTAQFAAHGAGHPAAKDVWLADNGVSLLIDGLVGRGSQR
jgi:hypothetical protein